MDLVLAVDKEPGLTSHDVVARARRALRERHVGHAGTLDPFATGVLVLLLGRATKVARFLSGATKTYEADVLLGRVTDSDDRTGAIVATYPVTTARADVEAALERFRGEIVQRPPRVSAVWVRGERMYRRARRGEDVEPPPRTVRVHDLALLAYDPPLVRLRLDCSAGTYVRAIARDLGDALGVGGSLDGLRRTRVGPFHLPRALPSRELVGPDAALRARSLGLSVEDALAFLPSATLSRSAAERLTFGQAPAASELDVRAPAADGPPAPGEPVRLVAPDGRLVAVGTLPPVWGENALAGPDRPIAIERVLLTTRELTAGEPSEAAWR